MKSKLPKALHEIYSRPMLEYLLNTVKKTNIEKVILVLGYGAEQIEKRFKDCDFVCQEELLGSGNAVNTTKKYFQNFSGDILVLHVDTPLLKSETINNLIKEHRENNCDATILTTKVDNPTGYGRILRNGNGDVVKIVEEGDADKYEEIIDEINIGAYCFKKDVLFPLLDKIKMNEKKKEYYFTDIFDLLKKANKKIGSFVTKDSSEGSGVNSRIDLARANEIIRKRVLNNIVASGVTIIDPSTTYIDFETRIGTDTIIYPNTVIEKDVEIGKNCEIGPFARLRPGTRLEDNVHIGNFAELVRTKVGANCKIKHMSYLGDAILGKNINIGAGTITANYDGKNKYQTIIEDNAFIGVGSILIAPVKIGKGAVVGAGSVVTKRHNVPDGKTVVGVPARIFKTKNKKSKIKNTYKK